MHKENIHDVFHALHIMCLVYKYIFSSDFLVLPMGGSFLKKTDSPSLGFHHLPIALQLSMDS